MGEVLNYDVNTFHQQAKPAQEACLIRIRYDRFIVNNSKIFEYYTKDNKLQNFI